MDSSFDQEINKFVSKDLTDLMLKNLLEEAKTYSYHLAVEKHTEQVSNLNVPPVSEKQFPSAAMPDFENALNLLIKEEPEMDAYEIENVPLEVPKNVYAQECDGQEHELSLLKSIVTEPNINLIDKLVHIPHTHINKNRQLVVLLENLKPIEKDGNCVDNLHGVFNLALNSYNKEQISTQNHPLVKMETNLTVNDLERFHEVAFQDWKIKNEDLNIKEELEESETRIITASSKRRNPEPQLIIRLERLKIVEKNESFLVDLLNKAFDTDLFGIASDRVCQDNQVKCGKLKSGKSDQLEDKISLKSDFYRKLPKSDHCIDKIVEESSFNLQHKYLEESKTEEGKVFNCNFQTKSKRHLRYYLPLHKSLEEVQKFKCDQCSYIANLKHHLTRHLLIHRNPEKKEIFQCNKCNFLTKYKDSLKDHLVRHKSSKEVQKFKCDQCSYKTVIKGSLTRHLLLHRNPEEVQIFQCYKCNFLTKSKKSLKTHLLQHKSLEKGQKFKCGQCSYIANLKSHLTRHLLIHRNPEEVEIFQCNKCNFLTKYKMYLKEHLFRHRSAEKVQKFKCDQCSYKTNIKSDLNKHFLRHNNPKESEMFKCNNCDYQTKNKSNLRAHLFRCNSPGEVQKFKCDQCSYIANFKHYLTRHLLLHKNPEEVEIFQCNKCSFLTKHKKYLKEHLFRHRSPEEVRKFKCDQCSYKTNIKSDFNKHLLRHIKLNIKEI